MPDSLLGGNPPSDRDSVDRLISLGTTLLDQLGLHDPPPARGAAIGLRIQRSWDAQEGHAAIEATAEGLFAVARTADLGRAVLPGFSDFVRVVLDLDGRLEPVRKAPAKRHALAERHAEQLERDVATAEANSTNESAPQDYRDAWTRDAEIASQLATDARERIAKGQLPELAGIPATVAQGIARQLDPDDAGSLYSRFKVALATLIRSREIQRSGIAAPLDAAGLASAAQIAARDGASEAVIPLAREIAAIRKRVEEAAPKTDSTNKTAQRPKLSKALLLLMDHQDWPTKRIAKEAGCSREYLARSPLFQKARAAQRTSLELVTRSARKSDRHWRQKGKRRPLEEGVQDEE